MRVRDASGEKFLRRDGKTLCATSWREEVVEGGKVIVVPGLDLIISTVSKR